MKMIHTVGLVVGLLCSLAASAEDKKSRKVETVKAYASIDGLKMYYEIHGVGKPLILLHGGVGGIEMFGPNLSAFSKTRQVIAVELQAHGRTADIDRPLRFELMADDIVALMKHLGIGKADVMGYSLGGGVALKMAVQHPELVHKLVIVSAPCKWTGWYPEVLASMAQMGPAGAEAMKQSPLYQLYPGVNWPRLFTKLGDLLRQHYDWSKEVATIKAPTMLIFADADAVTTTHIMEFFGLFGGGKHDAGLDGSGRPNAQLAILPGLTHYNILYSTMVAEVVASLLDAREEKRKE